MSNYDNYEENRYEDFGEETEILSHDTDRTTPSIDSAAIANASAEALNGPNGKDFCKTVRFIFSVLAIVGLAWIYEGGKNA